VEAFREAGKPHKLFFITDVRDMLRHEERNAWQSLVRVFSHEINNSLAPISSISQTLKRSLTLKKKDALNEDNLIEGLSIISQRAQNLTGFVNSYKQLSHLPKPKVQRVSLLNLLEKVVLLYKISPEQHIKVALSPCEETVLSIDPIQFEQVLINLTKNAVESMDSADSKGDINISWQTTQSLFTLTIADTGLGLKNMDNLFVPFYSTKKQGSGIGLVLCRQIIEAHGGQLKLVNRQDTKGCEAIIELPIDN
ncbi:MAG: sensor histidine kinase, partial [Colwellia sp.]